MNKEPTDEMINKRLAEFMGNKIAIPSNLNELSERQLKVYLPFTNSLDALVPVLDKLDCSIHNTNKYDGRWQVVLRFSDMNKPRQDWHENEKIQKATALATYYAVMENEKNG